MTFAKLDSGRKAKSDIEMMTQVVDLGSPSASPQTGLGGRMRSLWPLGVVILFACALNYPCAIWGMQPGADQATHLAYLSSFDAQLRSGELYPRWLSGLNYGAGSPIFFVQYPLPYYTSALLRRAFHLSVEPTGTIRALGLFLFFSAMLSGIFTWLWCRTLTNPIAAMLAAFVCLTMPYLYSFDLYWRSDIGEYSALAWVPLALYWAHRLNTHAARSIVGIGLSFAVIISSHIFTAVIFSPFLFLYAVVCAPRDKRFSTAIKVVIGMALAAGCVGVYVLPMYVHRPNFSLSNFIRLRDDNFFYQHQLFAFGKTLFPWDRIRWRVLDGFSGVVALLITGIVAVRWKGAFPRTPKILALVGVLFIVLSCVAPLLNLAGYVPHPDNASAPVIDLRGRLFIEAFLTFEAAVLAYACLRRNSERIPEFLLASALVLYFLMTRWSEVFWFHAKLLWSIQFPWRLTGVLSVFAVGLLALVFRELCELPTSLRWKALGACAVVWFMIAGVGGLSLGSGKKFLHNFPVASSPELETAYATYSQVTKLPTPEELGPKDDFVNGISFLKGEGTGRLEGITSRHLRLHAECAAPCTILVRQIYYPLWQAHGSSGQVYSLQTAPRAGLMQLSLGPGAHEVELELPTERAELYGAWLSLASLFAIMCLLLVTEFPFPMRRMKVTTPPKGKQATPETAAEVSLRSSSLASSVRSTSGGNID